MVEDASDSPHALAPGNQSVTRSPREVEDGGTRAAGELRQAVPNGADVVIAWEQDTDALVLAHVVARELHALRAEIYLDEGRVKLTDVPLTGLRAVLVAHAFTYPNSVRTAATALQSLGATRVAVACLESSSVFETELPSGVVGIDVGSSQRTPDTP